MDVAFVETGMKTGVSVDGVIPTSQRLQLVVREPFAASGSPRTVSDPRGEDRRHLAPHRLRNGAAPGDQREKGPTPPARVAHALKQRSVFGTGSGEATGFLHIFRFKRDW